MRTASPPTCPTNAWRRRTPSRRRPRRAGRRLRAASDRGSSRRRAAAPVGGPGLRVVGVGGGGVNAVNRMVEAEGPASSSSRSTPTRSRCSSPRRTRRCRSATGITRGLGSGRTPTSAAPPATSYDRIKALLRAPTWSSSPPARAAGPAPARRRRGPDRARARRAGSRHRHPAVPVRRLAPPRPGRGGITALAERSTR